MIKMILRYLFLSCLLLTISCQETNREEHIRQDILDHGQVIRDAFAEGDIETIKALHHPEVIKALGYNDLKKGPRGSHQGN